MNVRLRLQLLFLCAGGVAFSKILTETLNDVKHENLKVVELEVPEEKLGTLQKRRSGGRNLIGEGGVESVSDDGVPTNKSAEDVMRVFMMKEYFGTRFFDGLMVRESARGKGKKAE